MHVCSIQRVRLSWLREGREGVEKRRNTEFKVERRGKPKDGKIECIKRRTGKEKQDKEKDIKQKGVGGNSYEN